MAYYKIHLLLIHKYYFYFHCNLNKYYFLFLKNHIYNFIGSDAHNIKNRNTGLKDAIDLLNNDMNRDIFEDSSKKVLKNEKIEFLGEKIKGKKSMFSFLKR